MTSYPEPEILVPPDMEHLEIEEIERKSGFPYRRLAIMIILSALLLFVCGMGFNVYNKTGEIGEVIPYWIFSMLLLTPTGCSYYFFFSFFQPRLRNPYEWEN